MKKEQPTKKQATSRKTQGTKNHVLVDDLAMQRLGEAAVTDVKTFEVTANFAVSPTEVRVSAKVGGSMLKKLVGVIMAWVATHIGLR